MYLNKVSNYPYCPPEYLPVTEEMPVYHSTAELISNEKQSFKLLESLEDIAQYIKDITGDTFTTKIGLYNQNVFINTRETRVPLSYSDEHNEIIFSDQVTDACYIKLYVMILGRGGLRMYTSSGIWRVTMFQYGVSAAIKSHLKGERLWKTNREDTYNKNLKKLMEKKSPSIQHIKAVSSLFNPASPYFLNVDAALGKSFPTVKKLDRDKLISTTAFRKAIMDILKQLNPKLSQAIREKMPPETVANYVETLVLSTLETGEFEEKKQAIKFLIETGYEEQVVHNHVPLLPQVPMRTIDIGDTEPITEDEKKALEEFKENENYPDSYIATKRPEFDPTTIPDD